jgi:hypothetical protein
MGGPVDPNGVRADRVSAICPPDTEAIKANDDAVTEGRALSSGHPTEHPTERLEPVPADKQALWKKAEEAMITASGYHLRIVDTKLFMTTPSELDRTVGCFKQWYDVYEKNMCDYSPAACERAKKERPEWELAQRQKVGGLKGQGKLTQAEHDKILKAQHTSRAAPVSQAAPATPPLAKK